MAAPCRKMQCYNSLHCFKMLRNSTLVTFRKYCTMKSSIKALLATSIDTQGVQNVQVEGWINALQQHKKIKFFRLVDGTTNKELQVVCDKTLNIDDVTFGSSVSVYGDLVKSIGKSQTWEMLAKDVTVIGQCDADEFPIQQRNLLKVAGEDVREYLHLRPRTPFMSSLLQIRNAATMAVHKYFQSHDYIFIHTPILCSNDCEGAGEVFKVEPNNKALLETVAAEDPTTQKHFFGSPTYLSVSGQLHLEVMTSAFKKAYNFGPTFRAENSMGRHHLSEFYMIEGEVAFINSLKELLEIMEDMVKFTTQELLDSSATYLHHVHKLNNTPKQMEVLEKILKQPFHRLPYSEAVEILEKNNNNFENKVEWGCDFFKEHEKYLVREYGGDTPVFLTDFPASIKPFYAMANDDNTTVGAVDLLMPDVGELIGGSMREHRYDVMKERLDHLGLSDSMQWYLDLRKYGSVPHGGFGLGFERYLQFITGTSNIRDIIPFPRSPRNCKV